MTKYKLSINEKKTSEAKKSIRYASVVYQIKEGRKVMAEIRAYEPTHEQYNRNQFGNFHLNIHLQGSNGIGANFESLDACESAFLKIKEPAVL